MQEHKITQRNYRLIRVKFGNIKLEFFANFVKISLV